MKNLTKIISVLLLSTGFLFACRGGTHKNNDHDYDGKNENDDGSHMQQEPVDSLKGDTVSRYPINEENKE